MTTVADTINCLKDMGFSDERAQKALNKTGWQGVEQAMEWLLAHPEGEEESDDETEQDGQVPMEPTKVLTPEEIAEKMKRLEELRVKKRLEREETEKKEANEREKKRIEDGKKMTEIKQDMANKEMLRMAEERKREKKEDAKQLEKIRAQIQADRDRKKQEMLVQSGQAPPPEPKPAPAPVVQSNPTKEYDETKIQIRLTNGKTLVQSFKVKEPLSAVRLYIELHRSDNPTPGIPVKLMTSFPRKIFEAEDYEKPLDTLGLVPTAVIIVTK